MWGDGRMNNNILWSKILDEIKNELTSLAFDTWFKETELYDINNGKAYIIVPMPIHKKHLIDNYSNLIDKKMTDIDGISYELIFLLREEIEENTHNNIIEETNE